MNFHVHLQVSLILEMKRLLSIFILVQLKKILTQHLLLFGSLVDQEDQVLEVSSLKLVLYESLKKRMSSNFTIPSLDGINIQILFSLIIPSELAFQAPPKKCQHKLK